MILRGYGRNIFLGISLELRYKSFVKMGEGSFWDMTKLRKIRIVSSFGMFLVIASGCGTGVDPHLNAGVSPLPNGKNLTAVELNFLGLINQLRAENSLSPLEVDSHVQASAELHSAYMNQLDQLSHVEPSPQFSSDDRIKSTGGDFLMTGENIACGNADAQSTFNQWVNSSGHLANMLSPHYQYIGIARAGSEADVSQKNCPWYWTTDFAGN